MKKQTESIIRNERGFTLLEVVVAVMIIGVVGTLVLQTVVKANTSMEISNVQTFMDNLTQSAREAYKSDPENVLFKDYTNIYPFAGMSRTTGTTTVDATTGQTVYTKIFTQEYSSNLSALTTENDPNAMYKVEYTFVPMVKKGSIAAPGFQYKAAEYEMKSILSIKNKAGNTWNQEPLYDKSYSFDNISVINHAQSGIKYATVKLDPVDGTIDPIGAPSEFDVIIGDSIGSSLTQVAKKPGHVFKGWSKDRNSPGISAEVIKSSEIITGDTTLYAKYLATDEYVVTYQLDANQTFNVPDINPSLKSVDMGLKTTNPSPKIKDAKTADNKVDGSKMFANNTVSQSGKSFDGWADVNGNIYRENDTINPKYTVLKPIMIDTKEESIDLNVELDITGDNVVAKNTKTGIATRHILYPYTNASYEFYFDKGKPRVIGRNFQKDSSQSGINAIGGPSALHPINKGVPEVIYDSSTDGGTVVFKDKNGKSYNTFEEFYKNSPEIREAKAKNANQLVINKTTLTVKYKGINIESYTSYTGEKDEIKNRSGGSAISNDGLNSVFPSNEKPIGSGNFTTESMKKVSDAILEMDRAIKNVNVMNTVEVRFTAGDPLIAKPYTVGASGEKAKAYTMNLTLPTDYLKTGWVSGTNYNQQIKARVAGIRIAKRDGVDWIQINIQANYGNGEQAIGYGIRGSDGYVWLCPATDSNGYKIKIGTIRLRGDVHHMGSLELDKQPSLIEKNLAAYGDQISVNIVPNRAFANNPAWNEPYTNPPKTYNFKHLGIGDPGMWGVHEFYDYHLQLCFNYFSFTDAGYINYAEDWGVISEGGLSRSILTFAPDSGQKQVLPYWLVSNRKTK